MLQKRIGPPPEALVKEYGLRKADDLYKPFKRWADAIIITQDEMILVEGKIRSTPAVIGQLEFYGRIVKETPDLAPYKHLRLVLLLLTPWIDPTIEAYSASKGIRVAHYHPPWIDEYMREIQGYTSAEYQEAKAAREERESHDR